MNDDIRKLVEDMDDSGAGNDETALKTDEFVKNTIKSCRLFTEPADTVKYYGKDRRDFWNDDSDEVMLLCQFFNNAIVSGDPGSVEIARTGFEQLSEKDDEMLFDVIGSVLLRHIDPDGIIELFDPEKQPEFRRYNLAVAAKTHPEILDEERRNMIFDSLKKRMNIITVFIFRSNYLDHKNTLSKKKECKTHSSINNFTLTTINMHTAYIRRIPLMRKDCTLFHVL